MDIFTNIFYSKYYKKLQKIDPDKLEKISEKKAIKAFRYAAKHSQFYKTILKNHNINYNEIKTIYDFKEHVPILNKEEIFKKHGLHELINKNVLANISQYMISSGYSNISSFGVETKKNNKNAALFFEFLISKFLQLQLKDSILINCFASGVQIPCNTIPYIITGYKPESIITVIDNLRLEYKNFIIIGEHLVIKNIIEYGVIKGFNWKKINIHIITGGEYISEYYRSYIAGILGIGFKDTKNGSISINMGLTELTLSLLGETLYMIKLRRKMIEVPELRNEISGNNSCPELLQYFPENTYIETVKNGYGNREMIVTMLNTKSAIPIIRYNTGDYIKLMSYNNIKNILINFNLPELIPNLHLPIGIIYGREPDNSSISVNQIKDLLYLDKRIAFSITGLFKLQNYKKDGKGTLLIQLKKGIKPSAQLLKIILQKNKQNLNIKFIQFESFEHGIIENYVDKYQYSGGN